MIQKNKIYKISDYESLIKFLQKLYGEHFHTEEEAFKKKKKIMVEDISERSNHEEYNIRFKNEANKSYADVYNKEVFKFFIEVNKFTQEEMDL